MVVLNRLFNFIKSSPINTSVFCSSIKSGKTQIFKRKNHIIASSEAREISVPLPYGNISGKEWGNLSGHPIICLHGFADNANSFDTVGPLLSPKHHYIALDAGGHGKSSFVPGGTTLNFWDLVIHVKRVVNHFNFSKFSILGHSMGGSTGLLVGSLYPQNLERLVILDIIKPVVLPLAWHAQKVEEAIDLYLDFEKKTSDPSKQKGYSMEELVSRYVEAVGGTINPESVRILLQRGSKVVGNGYGFAHDAKMNLPTVLRFTVAEQRKVIKTLNCHLRIIKGKQGPLYESPSILEEFKNYYKQQCKTYDFIEVEGYHHVHMDHPERVAPHINEFFDSL